MTESNISILSTKELEQPYIEQAAAAGIAITCHSFIQIIPIDSEELITQIKELAQKKITAVFTSVNSASIVSAYIEADTEWNIYCINGATLNTVREQFKNCVVVDSAKNAAELSDKIIEERPTEAVVFFCSDIRRDTLVDKLSANNIQVQDITVYRTSPTPFKIREDFDGIIFFSPSAVRSFFSNNTITNKTVLFTIGDTTAAALENYPNPVIVSNTPDKGNIINTIIEHYKKQKHD